MRDPRHGRRLPLVGGGRSRDASSPDVVPRGGGAGRAVEPVRPVLVPLPLHRHAGGDRRLAGGAAAHLRGDAALDLPAVRRRHRRRAARPARPAAAPALGRAGAVAVAAGDRGPVRGAVRDHAGVGADRRGRPVAAAGHRRGRIVPVVVRAQGRRPRLAALTAVPPPAAWERLQPRALDSPSGWPKSSRLKPLPQGMWLPTGGPSAGAPGRPDQAPARAFSIAYAARRPWASPPAGLPGRSLSFQAYTSTCAQRWPSATKRSRNSAAVMLPAMLVLLPLAMSAIPLVR